MIDHTDTAQERGELATLAGFAQSLLDAIDAERARAEKAEAEVERLRAVLENIASTGRCEFAAVRAALGSTREGG